MFLVGGGILVHGVPPLHHAVEGLTQAVKRAGGAAEALEAVVPTLADGVTGVIAGILALGAVALTKRLVAS
jgi:predicted DNA repair protein MutK